MVSREVQPLNRGKWVFKLPPLFTFVPSKHEKMNIQKAKKDFNERLAGLYDGAELSSLWRRTVEHVAQKGYSRVLVDDNPDPNLEDRLEEFALRLATGEPFQYITGEVEFAGLRLLVNPTVLIPRPETEELLHLILQNHSAPNLLVMDVGTGSGCLPIALKHYKESWMLYAMDISPGALDTARENARLNHTEVSFFEDDILHPQKNYPEFDIMVSNPPYILPSERGGMHKNVLTYEPGLALFTPQDDPLVFYRAVLSFSKTHLKSGGYLYFELNADTADQCLGLVNKTVGFSAELVQDISGKPRFLQALKN